MQRTRALGHLFVFVSGEAEAEAEARHRMDEAGLHVTCVRACLDPDGAVGREVDRPPDPPS